MPYTRIDRFISRLRFRAAYPHIRAGSRVCDLGCGLEATFLDYASDRIAYGIGVDDQVKAGSNGRFRRLRADIRAPLPLESGQFDHVVMLAVLEHLAEPEPVLREAHRILAPSGSLILTWPAEIVDPLLDVLHAVHLVSDEMESGEHQRRIPVTALRRMLNRVGFGDTFHRRFEIGLNNLVVAIRQAITD